MIIVFIENCMFFFKLLNYMGVFLCRKHDASDTLFEGFK